jgi:hypothetical protein
MMESDHLQHPCLRQVDVVPVRMDGRDLVCLQDPEKLAEEPIFLHRPVLFLLARMDGRHSLRAIQADYCRATGDILPMEALESLVAQLDEKRYLDGPPFRAFCRELMRRFRESPSRSAFHAGSAYPADPEILRSQIRDYFMSPDGPGEAPRRKNLEPLRGLVAPHIDFARGGPAYAHAYAALRARPEADTFVIFGTCHAPMPQRFSISSKDYETPLGTARTDGHFVARLRARLHNEYADDFPHRGEHSIEFQAVFLRYALGDASEFRIVPILVNSFHDIYERGKTAAEEPEIQEVVAAIRETMRECGRRVCVIAGADLAHVGRRFGDPSGPTERSLRAVERADLAFLELVEAGDAEGVFRSIAAEGDRRRVCGYPPIYMTLRCIDAPKGKLLQYRQWSDPEEGAAVTFAALAVY